GEQLPKGSEKGIGKIKGSPSPQSCLTPMAATDRPTELEALWSPGEEGENGEQEPLYDELDTARNRSHIRAKLALILFLYVAGSSMVDQIYPLVLIEQYGDSEAARFLGWLSGVQSVLQLLVLPSVSALSDTVGRLAVIRWSLVVHFISVALLLINPSAISIISISSTVAGFSYSIVPAGQALIADLHRSEAGDHASHAFGLIIACFGLGVAAGPPVGGFLLKQCSRRTTVVAALSVLTVATVVALLFAWPETLSKRKQREKWHVVNPIRVMKFPLKHRVLSKLALCYAINSLAGSAFQIWYPYVHAKFAWTPVQIGLFMSFLGLSTVFAQSVGIRVLVPRFLSNNEGMLWGQALMIVVFLIYSAANAGWMLLISVAFGSMHSIAEPCMQAWMAGYAEESQGSLQGALFSLRTLASGFSGPAYGALFALGMSGKLMGGQMPGFPFFVAAVLSVLSCASAFWAYFEERNSDGQVL
ncbi:unnamed protein product, partial [Chrysoparadoxa australica]